MSINHDNNMFGNVTHDGETYRLTGQADHTNRLLPVNNYNDAAQGVSYDFEMSATGTDKDGNDVTVYWIFSAIKGEEGELDSYDYGDVDRVELV